MTTPSTQTGAFGFRHCVGLRLLVVVTINPTEDMLQIATGWLLNYTPLTMAQSWYGMYFICIYNIYWNHMKLKLLVYTACTLNTLFSHVFSTRSGAFPDFFANCRCGVSPCLRPLPTGSIPKTNLPIGAQVEPRKTCRTDESFYSFYHHFDSCSWIKKTLPGILGNSI